MAAVVSRIFGSVEKRDISAPWLPFNQGGSPYSAVSQERALHLGPVFAANRHITDFCSTLPLQAFRRVSEGERQPAPMPPLFRDLEMEGRLIPWLCQGMSSLVLRGNAVGLIAGTDGMGFPTLVDWVSMDRVHVSDDSGSGVWYIDGRRVSRVDLVHIPWITIPGRTLGLSPIEHYAATVDAGLGSQDFGNGWFANGGVPPSHFRNTSKELKDGIAAQIRARLVASIRRREPLVTGRDWEFTAISIPPEQAQFIETQKLTATQIATIYGIDPTEIGGESANSLTYSTEETRQIRRAADMRPYLTRFEEAFSSWMARRTFLRFNTDATVRVDIKTRHEVYKVQSDIGLTSTNERRTKEDLPPVEGGDSHAPLGVQKEAQSQGTRRLSVVHDQEAQYE